MVTNGPPEEPLLAAEPLLELATPLEEEPVDPAAPEDAAEALVDELELVDEVPELELETSLEVSEPALDEPVEVLLVEAVELRLLVAELLLDSVELELDADVVEAELELGALVPELELDAELPAAVLLVAALRDADVELEPSVDEVLALEVSERELEAEPDDPSVVLAVELACGLVPPVLLEAELEPIVDRVGEPELVALPDVALDALPLEVVAADVPDGDDPQALRTSPARSAIRREGACMGLTFSDAGTAGNGLLRRAIAVGMVASPWPSVALPPVRSASAPSAPTPFATASG